MFMHNCDTDMEEFEARTTGNKVCIFLAVRLYANDREDDKTSQCSQHST